MLFLSLVRELVVVVVAAAAVVKVVAEVEEVHVSNVLNTMRQQTKSSLVAFQPVPLRIP